MLEIVRVAIFADPGRTRQQLVVALHVAERRARDDGTVEIGPLVHRRSDQHAAVGATGAGDLARLANAGANPLLPDRLAHVAPALAALHHRAPVPGRAISTPPHAN